MTAPSVSRDTRAAIAAALPVLPSPGTATALVEVQTELEGATGERGA
jgi:hypothetical protein